MKLLLIAVALLAIAIVLGGGAVVFTNDVTDKLSKAIAQAEGFYVPGSRPARNHNPGDMTKDLIGKSIGKDGAFVVYATDEDGFANLRKQLSLVWGGSAYYNPFMTIAQFASVWTATEADSWATNVANALGVSTDTQLDQLT
jgi:uncharacterized membrane protein (DUF485 family)